MANTGELSFHIEWEDPQGVRGPELRATWARLTIAVAGEPITQVHDAVAKSVRDGIYVPTYPLAEWVASHWWQLLWECDTPGFSRSRTYRSRHSLRAAREGFALPDLCIRPEGQSIGLVWEPHDSQAERVRFLRRGAVHLEADQVRAGLRDLVVTTVQRLDVQGICGTLLQEEWAAVQEQEAQCEEAAFCRAAAALGLDPYGVSEAEAQRIVSAAASLPEAMRQDFFAVGELGCLVSQAEKIRVEIEAVRGLRQDLKPLKQWRRRLAGVAQPAGAPWQVGYEFARRLRCEQGAPTATARSMSELAGCFGLEEEQLCSVLITPQHETVFFDALMAVNENGTPGFVLDKRREEARRFVLSRALYEYLTCSGDAAALLTAARSDRQKANRAFAAEFLAPAGELQARLPNGVVTEEEMEELASQFNVSPYVIRHQITNHGLARLLEE